jgi:hypothetical protein
VLLAVLKDHLIFLGSPLGLHNRRVEVVEPSLAALFGRSMREDGRDLRPSTRTVSRQKIDNELVANQPIVRGYLLVLGRLWYLLLHVYLPPVFRGGSAGDCWH